MTCTTHHHSCECREAKIAKLQRAAEDVLSMAGLDWYFSKFIRDTAPTPTSSGIVARISNYGTEQRAVGAYERLRLALAEFRGEK